LFPRYVVALRVLARRSTSTQEHNNPSRDSVYIDSAFTPSAAANLTRDLGFNGTISGNVYVQPLYYRRRPERADDYRSY